MSRKKSVKARKKLLAAEQQRKQILEELLREGRMLRGSYAQVYTKCGKQNCWCKDGKGHPHSRITWSEKGEGITRKVPREEIAWVQEVTDRYRRFRSLRRELVRLEAEVRELLNDHEKNVVEKTRSGKDFLEIERPNRSRQSPKVTKKANRKKETLA